MCAIGIQMLSLKSIKPMYGTLGRKLFILLVVTHVILVTIIRFQMTTKSGLDRTILGTLLYTIAAALVLLGISKLKGIAGTILISVLNLLHFVLLLSVLSFGCYQFSQSKKCQTPGTYCQVGEMESEALFGHKNCILYSFFSLYFYLKIIMSTSQLEDVIEQYLPAESYEQSLM